MSIAEQRKSEVENFVRQAKSMIKSDGANSATLSRVKQMLEELTRKEHLFPFSDFPSPASGKSKRYKLHVDDDQSYALYLNSVLPGKDTAPHNHKTWAIVSSIEGDELNRIYRRKPDGGGVEVAKEVVVSPGHALLFDPEDIHSVHYHSAHPGRQLHFYGRALETLTDRSGFDQKTGAEVNYNTMFSITGAP